SPHNSSILHSPYTQSYFLLSPRIPKQTKITKIKQLPSTLSLLLARIISSFIFKQLAYHNQRNRKQEITITKPIHGKANSRINQESVSCFQYKRHRYCPFNHAFKYPMAKGIRRRLCKWALRNKGILDKTMDKDKPHR